MEPRSTREPKTVLEPPAQAAQAAEALPLPVAAFWGPAVAVVA